MRTFVRELIQQCERRIPRYKSIVSMTATTSAAGGGKWFDKLAVPQSTPASMDIAMLHELLVTQSKTNSMVKVLIVDVRRADMEMSLHDLSSKQCSEH